MPNAPVHASIKKALGYPPNLPDKEFWKDWSDRTTKVCKPCWELKYCPYGKLVDLAPLLPGSRQDAIEHVEELKEMLKTGRMGEKSEISPDDRVQLERLAGRMESQPHEFALEVENELRVQMLVNEALEAGESDPIAALLFRTEPIEFYRSAFPIESSKERKERAKNALTPRVKTAIRARVKQIREWLKKGVLDQTKPLEPWRRRMFKKRVAEFKEVNYPDTQPCRICETACNVYGHVCPVFFAANSVTETADARRRGRYISFETKIRVVRRDNHTCQHCGKHLLDTEVEFDHIIPVSKGGSSEEHNVRLTCFSCNRTKSNKVRL